jgi:hypothetical protein
MIDDTPIGDRAIGLVGPLRVQNRSGEVWEGSMGCLLGTSVSAYERDLCLIDSAAGVGSFLLGWL